MCRIMNRYTKLVIMIALLVSVLFTAAALAEAQTGDAEQGLDEIRQLLEITDVDEKEGMSLEEMTEAFAESAMNEYLDNATGFSMQYPSVFQFDEDQRADFAATADGKATLNIENIIIQNELDEEMLLAAREMLLAAIGKEALNAAVNENEQNGCLRRDMIINEGKTGQTDLYLLTKTSLHHITICYPAEEQGTYSIYIEYMINTMETNETDLG